MTVSPYHGGLQSPREVVERPKAQAYANAELAPNRARLSATRQANVSRSQCKQVGVGLNRNQYGQRSGGIRPDHRLIDQ